MRKLYCLLATLALAICFMANLLLVVLFAMLELDMLRFEASDTRNIGMVMVGLVWLAFAWTLGGFIRELPKDLQDIWNPTE